MNKSKIDWCDMTWNPVTGCLHGCKYCYAEKIANRFSLTNIHKLSGTEPRIEVLEETYLGFTKDGECKVDPYPFGFSPTFHKYKLNEPTNVKKPQKIFVCSMADLFGQWIPDEWIKKVFKACWEAPQHKYIFLTKNPKKYNDFYYKFPENSWLGTTITCQDDIDKINETTKAHIDFYSIEPLLSEIDVTNISHWFYRNKLLEVETKEKGAKWIIIGAQTGPGAIPPKLEWVQSIINQARDANIPVFLKSNLNCTEIIQEFPEGLKEREE